MKIYDRQSLRVRESLQQQKKASSDRETARGGKIIEPKILLGWGDSGNSKQLTGWSQEPRWCRWFRSTGLTGRVWDEWKQDPVINPHLSSGRKMPHLKPRGVTTRGGRRKEAEVTDAVTCGNS